jgi:hypothetical protein
MFVDLERRINAFELFLGSSFPATSATSAESLATLHDALSLVCGPDRVVNPHENVWIHVGSGSNGKSAAMDAAATWVRGVVKVPPLPRAVNAALENSGNRLILVGGLPSKNALATTVKMCASSPHTQVHFLTSHLPPLEGGQGVLRRTNIVMWEHEIPSDRQIPNFSDHLRIDPRFVNWLRTPSKRV